MTNNKAMNLENFNLAEIVNDLKEATHYDINFISVDGFILYSTNNSRIGDFHMIGKVVCESQQTVEVTTEEVTSKIKAGINSPIIVNGNVIGCIGITGNPSSIRKYQSLTIKLTSRYIQAQLYLQDSMSSKRLNNKIIESIVANKNLYVYHSDLLAKNLKQGEDMCALMVLGLTDIQMQELLNKIQTTHLSRTLENRIVIFLKPSLIEDIKTKCSNYNSQYVIGPLVKSYTKLEKSYVQAKRVAIIAPSIKQNIDCNQINHNILIANQYSTNKDYYYDTVLFKMEQTYNQRTMVWLCNLIIEYFQSNKSVSTAASIMYTTNSTVKYQLKKLNELISITNNNQELLHLYIAAWIYIIDNDLEV